MFEERMEAAFRGLGVSTPHLLRPRELTTSMQQLAHVKGLAAWSEYATAAEIHRQLAQPTAEVDVRQLDGWAHCSARVGAALGVTPGWADNVIRRGLALRDRLPQVNEALRAGRVAPHHVGDIVSRTELVDGMPWSASVDGEIAEMLWRDGAWSADRMRNMVDQIVFRHDPEGVRERRSRARDGRNFKRYATADGMADVVASMTAENALLLEKRVQQLATQVCGNDPRTTPQRLSDAMFCATMDVDFLCQCGDSEGCEFARPHDSDGDSDGGTQFVVHVVMDQATVEGRANNAALMDGHGVISGDHAREIARRPDARVAPLGGELAKDVLDQPSSVPDSAADDLHTPAAKELSPEELLDEIKRLVKAKEDAKRPPTKEPNVRADENGARAEESSSADFDDSIDDKGHSEHDHDHDHGHGHDRADNDRLPQPEGEADSTHPAHGAQASEDVPPDHSSEAAESGHTDTAKAGNTAEPEDPVDAHTEHPRTESTETTGEDSQPNTPEPKPPAPESEAACERPNRAERRRRRTRKTQTALPKSQPGNAYRLSAALNRFVRIRDAYCTFPGCRRPAWKSEVDHTDEYDHDNPDAGGQTSAEGTKCLCKFHHLLKTFGNWIDFQVTDENGRTRIVFISPEGVRFHGPAWSGEDLFPALLDMTWRDAGPRRGAPPDMPTRGRTRLADKYARRRAERNRNRRRIETPTPPPPPPEQCAEHDGPPPPF
ncbi:HNH endonuclease signature motif containing protein [Williamsia sp. 1138]|uniref:HNH endonuclease signature motif containing protein n=1 Tax=Williamsia sp. 1138 TaxID=1903117 RepID=UPI001FEEF778|nr:HNH endonuclease signature motif containing protein [Williamsia sp. 1138]